MAQSPPQRIVKSLKFLLLGMSYNHKVSLAWRQSTAKLSRIESPSTSSDFPSSSAPGPTPLTARQHPTTASTPRPTTNNTRPCYRPSRSPQASSRLSRSPSSPRFPTSRLARTPTLSLCFSTSSDTLSPLQALQSRPTSLAKSSSPSVLPAWISPTISSLLT